MNALSRPKAVFWDIDGTLITTEPLHYEVIRDWCAERGYVLSARDNETLLGKTMPEKWRLLRRHFPDHVEEAAFRAQCAHEYMRRLRPEMMRAEVVATAQKLHALGVPQAAVSNGESEIIEANLRVVGLWEIMRFTVCGNDVSQGKPAPDPYLEAARRAGVEPRHCWAVEDSPVGVASAVLAGMVVLAWPEQDTEFVETCRVLRTVADFPWQVFAP